MEIENISFMSAFNSTKDIGGEYNRLISKIDDEWIFIKDGDSLFLTSDYGDRINKIIDSNEQFDVIGAITNRISVDSLRSTVDILCEPDMDNHIRTSNELWSKNGTMVTETKDTVAAFCMFFRREVWEKSKFKENSIVFDREFCKDAIDNGFKIGIAQGLYLFHLYRWGKNNPKYYTNHLI